MQATCNLGQNGSREHIQPDGRSTGSESSGNIAATCQKCDPCWEGKPKQTAEARRTRGPRGQAEGTQGPRRRQKASEGAPTARQGEAKGEAGRQSKQEQRAQRHATAEGTETARRATARAEAGASAAGDATEAGEGRADGTERDGTDGTGERRQGRARPEGRGARCVVRGIHHGPADCLSAICNLQACRFGR